MPLLNDDAALDGALLAIVNAVQTTTATGTQQNVALDGPTLHLRCNNASALTFGGFVLSGGNISGARLILDNVGSSTVKVATEDASSTAANRCICLSDDGQIVGPGGRLLAIYDGTTARWRVTLLEPGDPIAVAHNAGDYTGSGSLTFTVASGDLTRYLYTQRGRQLDLTLRIDNASTGGTAAAYLKIACPAGFTPSHVDQVVGTCFIDQNGTVQVGLVYADATGLYLSTGTLANWSNTLTNTLDLACRVTVEID
jgi:hypothetical protein